MGIFNFFKFDSKQREITIYNTELQNKIAIYENAINRCVSIISKMCSKCEIEYYANQDGKLVSVKNDTYYKLNVKANPNETASELLNKFFTNLLKDNEALIISLNKNLYVADTWSADKTIINERRFSNIVISNSDNYQERIYKTFNSSEVIYVNLNDDNIRNVNEKIFGLYADFFTAASDNYIYNNLYKWRLTPPNATIKIKDVKTGKEIANEQYKAKISDGLLEKKSSMMMLQDNIKLEQINSSKVVNSNDLFNVKQEFNNEIASNYHIPLSIYYLEKDISKETFNNFITFAIEPILELFEDRLNCALISKDKYLKGEKICITKYKFRHQDILDVASSVNLLFGDGYSHNDINKFMKLPLVDEAWANKHHITKNVDDATNAKGGDDNG